MIKQGTFPLICVSLGPIFLTNLFKHPLDAILHLQLSVDLCGLLVTEISHPDLLTNTVLLVFEFVFSKTVNLQENSNTIICKESSADGELYKLRKCLVIKKLNKQVSVACSHFANAFILITFLKYVKQLA